jgi:hypothetical protein
MNPFLERCRVCTISNEVLQLLEFFHGTSLEAPRVMEDEFVIAPENQLILDVVFPALAYIGKDARRFRVQYVMTLTSLDPST